ncbi:UDP-N-acetylmuramoyl-tripeptide--D-alanyl-D-alanine ligase [Novosphingobium aerophilum]|uniref:UDP-N-acetylmuramoyl-tripeptide--D-alanyl-D-alanine ligase n=1 Tax=Novosphingobium aerophilum TaxID=2839843 RepID=A0A7X1F5Z1_9SPHN|nr:UDP-N-acetylmuramoyl-tripeptide--D-alanyl-D-alanine ligase [Novosphingobium aerophilum]MBC2650985.1 UDP-N-acetylmuramoyl-tripeptide--D-alanyl-D-alanine ligase [Novosphingobium aerophilum]
MNAHAALIDWPVEAFESYPLALWTSAEIAAATGGQASGDFQVSGVEIDSRDVREGDLFFALKGETTDGHRFLEGAFAKGAAAAVVDRPVPWPHVLVADTTRALEALGAAARARLAPDARVIGVTGSVGKTSVKEALFAALDRASHGRAHRSVKSYNNHVGVPLSLARTPAGSTFGVYEMGMNHAGEIAALTVQVRPNVAMITAIAPAHIENLGSIEAIADAKAEIVRGLEPGGVAILPADSPHFARLRAAALLVRAQVVSFGRSAEADVRLLDAVPAPGGGSLVTADMGDRRLCYTIASPGDHWVVNSLAVMAAVRAVGGDLGAAGLALAELEGLKGRGARHVVPVAGGTALVIDESYNANPASMEATLAQLGNSPARRRIAVLGAMKELGEHGPRFHAELAAPLIAARVDQAVLVGEEMAALAEQLGKSGDNALGKAMPFAHCRTAAEALDILAALGLNDGDVVLVKGSNSVGLGRVVEALTTQQG